MFSKIYNILNSKILNALFTNIIAQLESKIFNKPW